MKTLLLFSFLLFLNQAEATTFTVSNTNDAGAGSLRQAIINANTDASATSGGRHVIDATGVIGTITLVTSLPQINNYLLITGSSGGLTISGNNLVAILSIASGKEVSLDHLIIKNALSSTGGAGINNAGSGITIDNCTFDGNVTTGSAQGGAIWHGGGVTAGISNCTFKNNSSSNTGGAVANYAKINFTNCTFASNSSNGGSAVMDYSSAHFKNCTITGNTGDGIYSATTGTILDNSIVVGNTTDIIGSSNVAINYCLLGITSGITVVGANNTTGLFAAAVFGSNMLANNGGITETIVIINPGPAVNAGSNISAPATDQRGTSRDASPDIGAYESIGPTGIKDEIISNGIKILSNPSDGVSYFEANESIVGDMEWEIINAEGNHVLKNKANKGSGTKTYMIDLKSNPPGVYYLIIYLGRASAIKELVKN